MAFERVTTGPLNPTGVDPFDAPGLVFDQQNNVLAAVGNSRNMTVQQSAQLILTAQTALTAITTAQNLFTKAFPAGALNVVGRTLLITGFIIYTSPGTTTPTITIAITLGGVTLVTITTSGISATASTNLQIQFQFQATIVSTGASGTLEAHGDVAANLTANTPGGAVNEFADTNTAVSSAVNLTNALTLAATIAASSTVTSAQLRMASVELVA